MYDRVGAERLLRGLSEGVLLAQGPMGTALLGEVGGEGVPAAFWNVAEPQLVTRHHALHERAGADVMITNSFQASAPALARDGIWRRVGEVNRAAADCALAAHADVVLGSIGPCGIEWAQEGNESWQEAVGAYREQAAALLAASCSGLLLETFASLRELAPALAGAVDAADGMPVLASACIDDEARLIGDGSPIEEAIELMERSGASAVGVNCCSLAAASVAVPRIAAVARTPFMVRPHAGMPVRASDETLCWTEDPESFARACLEWRNAGASLVGACCGATARTTCAMASALDKFAVA